MIKPVHKRPAKLQNEQQKRKSWNHRLQADMQTELEKSTTET